MRDNVVQEKLKIIGMHCATCAVTIENKLRLLKGIVDAQVNLASEVAVVLYDSEEASMKTVRDVGYDVYEEELLFIVKGLRSSEEEGKLEDRLGKPPKVID